MYYLSSLPRKLGQKRLNAAGLLKEAYKKKKQYLCQLREESPSSRSGSLSRRSSTSTNVEDLGPLIPREVETESLLKDDGKFDVFHLSSFFTLFSLDGDDGECW